MLSAKEYFSVMKDRDYITILFLICFCLSFLGIALHIFSYRDAGLFFMTVLLSRLLFIYKAEAMLDSVSKTLMKKMDEERARPGFENGNLSSILDSEFPRLSGDVRMKCIKKFVDSNEIELGPAGDYTFYSKKIYRRP